MNNHSNDIAIVLFDDKLVSNRSIYNLLEEVYVNAGYTDQASALILFDAEAVCQRGHLYMAIEASHSQLVGMVILVPPESPACKLAKQGEAEIHLLAVKPAFRGYGIGRKLITAAIDHARRDSYQRIILWTQPSMKAAQALYQSCGFSFVEPFKAANKAFLRFDKDLTSNDNKSG